MCVQWRSLLTFSIMSTVLAVIFDLPHGEAGGGTGWWLESERLSVTTGENGRARDPRSARERAIERNERRSAQGESAYAFVSEITSKCPATASLRHCAGAPRHLHPINKSKRIAITLYYFRKAAKVIDRLELGQIAAVPIRGSSSPALCEYLRANISGHLHEVSFCCQWLQSRGSLCPRKVKHLGMFFHILCMYLCITVFMHVNPGEMVSPGNIWVKPVRSGPAFRFMHIRRVPPPKATRCYRIQKSHFPDMQYAY